MSQAQLDGPGNKLVAESARASTPLGIRGDTWRRGVCHTIAFNATQLCATTVAENEASTERATGRFVFHLEAQHTEHGAVYYAAANSARLATADRDQRARVRCLGLRFRAFVLHAEKPGSRIRCKIARFHAEAFTSHHLDVHV